MCGLAGILNADGRQPVAPQVTRRMADVIAHRGPDAEGFWFGEGIGLAHRRLAIIDLSEGNQPMHDASDSLHIVFNGEIYNYLSLREDLISRGHPIRTHSDTEVLLYLYRQYGRNMVDHLRGMYAFAIWDSEREGLFLARDRIGQKPLYYFQDDQTLAFASEIKSILTVPGIDRTIDPRAIEAYLTYGFIPDSLSVFRSIRKLPPAHFLDVDRRSQWHAKPQRYWDLQPQQNQALSEEQWVERIRDKVSETVRCHRIADVSVGAFLSGGVDSSAMVAEMSAQSNSALKTFSIGFQEEGFSELPYARKVAKQYGTDHVEEIVTPDIESDFDLLIHHYDEPFADTSALPTLAVARVASQYVKVVISGDGGDEAFGGYSRYQHDLREAAIRRWIPTPIRRFPLTQMALHWPRFDWMPRPLRLKSLLTNLSRESSLAYANTMAISSVEQRQRILLAGSTNTSEKFVLDTYPGNTDDLLAMTVCDTRLVLPDDFLVKVDRASMAFGLEVRPPLVDHEILELAMTVPSHLKVREGEGKWILKKVFEDRLPSEILYRKKQGFEIPVDAWMRGPLRDRLAVAIENDGPLSEYIDTVYLNRLRRSHERGIGRHGQLLWSMLVLGQWLQHYGTNSTGSPSVSTYQTLTTNPNA